MNKKIKWLLLAVLVISFAFPQPVSAESLDDDRIIFGETYTLESGRIFDGNLYLIGAVIDIQKDAVVSGDIYAVGSAGVIDGTIEGSLITIGGAITLDENAVIMGDMISPTSYINQEEGVIIEGEQYEGFNFPLPELDIDSGIIPEINTSSGWQVLSVFNTVARSVVVMLVLIALAALLLLIIPKQVEVMTNALCANPWQMLGFGALTALVMLIGGIILTITICMIPVVILVGLTFGLAVLTGWLTLGYELGKRISSVIFKTTWHPVLSAVIGNLILYLVTKGLDYIPCIGGFLVFVAAMFGLGMVVVTLFGTNPYPRGASADKNKQIILNQGDENKAEITQQDDEVEKEKTTKDETQAKE